MLNWKFPKSFVLLAAAGFTAYLVMPSIGVAAANTAADEATIRAGTRAWIAAYGSSGVERMLALYTEDALLMPPDSPPFKGIAAMREYLTKATADAKASGNSLKDVSSGSEVGVSGDLAWHSGKVAVVDKSGNVIGNGKYLEVWKKISDKWYLIRDTWNYDAPAGSAAPKK